MKRLTCFLFATAIFGAGVHPPVLWVRSQTELSSNHSQPGSRVTAVVIQDYSGSGAFSIPMGSLVTGRVVKSSRKSQSSLLLKFESVSIAGHEFPLEAHVSEVDNARERVEPDGTILGLEEFRKRPGKVESLLLAAAFAHPAILGSVEAAKYVIREVKRPEVQYPAGTDIALIVDEVPSGHCPVQIEKPDSTMPAPLARIFDQLPNRTTTKNQHVPADWINLAFVGSRARLAQAFEVAGWSSAGELSLRADFKTFMAVTEHHSYTSAPVFEFLLSGRPPEFVYQKQTNTFAKRHHIRIWSTGQTWNGQPVWIASATHDIGIDFSLKAKTFAHQVDPNIDLERLKIVDDLRFTRQVASISYMNRPFVPHTSKNATGDVIHTDGLMVTIVLNH